MLPSFAKTGYVVAKPDKTGCTRRHVVRRTRRPDERVKGRSMTQATRAEATRSNGSPSVRGRPAERADYAGSRFAEVWRTVAAAPYGALPDRRLGLRDLPRLIAKGIYAAARRTLTTREDLLPPFEKLVHPSGICLRGTWHITEPTSYTGLFATGSAGLIIARASDALGEHRAGKLRFLGLAGKLYDTTDPDHPEPRASANFVMLENLAGTHTEHFVEATLSTDLLPMRPHVGAALDLPLVAIVGPAFAAADRARQPTQPAIRQLYPIAELGDVVAGASRAPVVMRLVPSPRNRRVQTADLREELQMHHHPDGIRYDIEVADRRSYVLPRGFRRIGELHFTDSVASYSGDHRLHFAHAPYRHSRADKGRG
jgi:hypothetical protein